MIIQYSMSSIVTILASLGPIRISTRTDPSPSGTRPTICRRPRVEAQSRPGKNYAVKGGNSKKMRILREFVWHRCSINALYANNQRRLAMLARVSGWEAYFRLSKAQSPISNVRCHSERVKYGSVSSSAHENPMRIYSSRLVRSGHK